MQSVLRLRAHLARRILPSLQSSKYHRPSIPRRSKPMSEGFFRGRIVSQPDQPTFHHGILRRTFASGRGGDPLGSFYSARNAKWVIIGLNTIVFGAWQYGIVNKDRNFLERMTQNFTISLRNIQEGRYYTMLTSAFSHQALVHFIFNMVSLNAFASILTFAGLGGGHLTSLCIGSAIIGSAAFLGNKQQQLIGGSSPERAGLGASGMVMGAAAAATCLMPFAPMQMMFIPINIPLWVLTLAYAGLDTYYLHSNSPVGRAAHLGGSFFGLAYYFLYLRRFGGVWNMLGRGIRR